MGMPHLVAQRVPDDRGVVPIPQREPANLAGDVAGVVGQVPVRAGPITVGVVGRAVGGRGKDLLAKT